MSGHESDELGNRGQKKMESWLSTVEGGVLNPPERDRTGWDFIYEFPPPNTPNLPLDKQTTSIKCWLQIKSTYTSTGSQRIPVSNLIHLIQNPMPVFFVILVFNKSKECEKTYLIHLGEEYIKQTLYELRKFSSEETNLQKKTPLKRRYVKFIYNEEHYIDCQDKLNDETSGHNFTQAIINVVQQVGGINKYISWKNNLWQTTGNNGYTITFSASLPQTFSDPEDYVTDFIVGNIPEMEARITKVIETRFAIPILRPDLKHENILLQNNSKTVEVGVLVFHTDCKNPSELQLETKLRKAAVGSSFKLRFYNHIFDYTFPKNEFLFAHPDLHKKLTLNEICLLSKTILFFRDALHNQTHINISSIRKGFRHYLTTIHYESLNILLTKKSWEMAEYVKLLSELICNAEAGILLETTLLEISQQFKQIIASSQLVKRESLKFNVKLPAITNTGEFAYVSYVSAIKIGQAILVVSALLEGSIKLLTLSNETKHLKVEVRNEKTNTLRISIINAEDDLQYQIQRSHQFNASEIKENWLRINVGFTWFDSLIEETS